MPETALKEALPFDREGFATVREVCEYLGLSPTTVHEMINREPPAFPAARFGKNGIRIARRGVVAFADSRLLEGVRK